MAFPGSGKGRAERIPADYFKHPSRLAKTKQLLSGFAFLGTVAYIGWMFGMPDGQVAFTHGPVAEVHAAIESNCTQCHEPFVPIRDDTLAATWKDSNIFGKNFSNSISIEKCQKCHAAASHHPTSHPESEVGCSSCHQDHNGRLGSLLEMSDLVCTKCHADLKSHIHTPPDIRNPELATDIRQFNTKGGHPEFRSLKKDPGTIKFSHAQHMRKGIPNSKGTTPDEDASPHKLDKATKPHLERYRLADQTDEFVQLQCTTCHRIDQKSSGGGKSGSSIIPERPSGAYMLPVSYENDCKACHQLSILAGETAEDAQLAHGQTPEQIHETLLGRIWKSNPGKRPGDGENDASQESGPAVLQDLSPAQIQEAEKSVASFEQKLFKHDLSETERHLQNVCAKCHTYQVSDAQPESLIPRVLPAAIPQVWLKHAKFDHASHRTMSCTECHAAALTSDTHSDVMIEGMQTCIGCHSPFQAHAPQPELGKSAHHGGASFRCVECHRYHVGSKPPDWYHDKQ